jgi:putrescine transport system ATP-binding protein
MTLADRIAVMDHGKIIQIGTPAEIYEQPNSKYVADFIGNINLLEGKVLATGNGAIRMESVGTGASIAVNQDVATAAGSTAWFAVRPEKLSVSLDQPADVSVNALSGEVIDIGYLGDISVYHVRLPTGAMVKATLTNRTRLVERPITWSDKVWLTWTADSGVVLTR